MADAAIREVVVTGPPSPLEESLRDRLGAVDGAEARRGDIDGGAMLGCGIVYHTRARGYNKIVCF